MALAGAARFSSGEATDSKAWPEWKGVMTAIALIGGDGAGKTTLAERLVADYPKPVKYLYMGINAGSSNIALPSTRLMYALKTRKVRAERSERGEVSKDSISLYKLEDRRDKRGKLWSILRLMNRIAEESFRQVVSWTYQLRGFVVIYDRHFLFDFTGSRSLQFTW